jgi:hypothetical protein
VAKCLLVVVIVITKILKRTTKSGGDVWRKTCRASLSTNIFDLKDDNPIITVLEVSFRLYDYCNNVLSLNLMINLLNRSALLHWF